MRTLYLERYFYGPGACLGLLRWEHSLLYTLEDAWNGNKVGESCIPDGTYRCAPRMFYRGGYPAIEVTGVPGRSEILFHRGNTASDVRGCIVPGMRLGVILNQLAVIDSKGAWDRFYSAWGHEPFDLTITPTFPLPGTRTHSDEV